MSEKINVPQNVIKAGRSAFISATGTNADAIEAAFLAMISAWPGSRKGKHWTNHTGDLDYVMSIILPLQENSND